MAFKKFTRRTRTSTPKVTVFARGLIEFNAGATRKFALTRYNYVVLYFDRETRQVGIQFTNNAGEQGAIRVIKKANGIVIAARPFLEHHGLLEGRSIAYDMIYAGEHDMFIIQFPEAKTAVHGES